MINVSGNLWVPSEGFKYLTNGETWTDSIYLGRNQDINCWRETNDEPPEPTEEPTEEEQSTALTRYSNELTGASDETLIEAAETMILKISKEENE